ncbi:hypothetical protein CNQ87_15405 [Lysinibacillus fusiformis]|uniref:hypothetical protein n=1 Tax=Lysinibacillus fusiformis TaxID=28031 RepID=UPI000BBA4299|nr:hypothetical protein [Lysinibacillus fusiformis]PCD81992.1 hypothetical protein CNQ87_15405 [Lysinibacillus fusiformis]
MGKFVKTSYTTPKEILKFPDHHMSVAVTVDDVGVMANAEGRKIIPAGTIVGGGFLANRSVKVKKVNDATSEGVLRYNVDVTQGPAPGAAVIHGFVDLNKLPEAPSAEAITALKQITFLK